MATSLWQLLEEYKVVIPIIQRDYAQGRQLGKAPVIRERFLATLLAALEDNATPLELDFIYGYIENRNFIPLDGQQRLTTLFLLHWFIAVKENRLDEAKQYLSKFTYQTRHSSRVFCSELIMFSPDDLNCPIDDTIINQPWFFTAWINDPTVSSMLTMLKAIQEKFSKVDNAWAKLTSPKPRIIFHLLPMDKLGLPDDLYIKMNSRGKELTEFEHFKSRFSEILTSEDADIFNHKVDQSWSDLFWNLYRDKESNDIAKLVDSGFLRFFRYITDILVVKCNIDVNVLPNEFAGFQQVYKDKSNVKYLFACLDVLSATFQTNPVFFESVFYINESDFSIEKVRLFFGSARTDLFSKCSDSYDASVRNNPFSIGEQLLLFACLEHLIHQTADFDRQIRVLRNLIANSEDTVRKENMPSLLQTVSDLIIYKRLDDNCKFSTSQVKEEKAKQRTIEEKIGLREIISRLEDHDLCRGCVAIFKWEDNLSDYADAFRRVFIQGSNYELISRALLTFGDYSQKYSWRRQLGNQNDNVWRELFTPSERRGDFKKTKEVLYGFLGYIIKNPSVSLDKIIEDFIASFQEQPGKPKDWRYYFIKYPEFRKHEYGFYYWPIPEKQYECTMMRRSTLGGFYWSPFLVALKQANPGQLSLENYGHPLVLVKGDYVLRIRNVNQGFKLEAMDDMSKGLLNEIKDTMILNENDVFEIVQDKEGNDLEDRIEKGNRLMSEIFSHKSLINEPDVHEGGSLLAGSSIFG